MVPFVSPLGYICASAGPEETKNLAGRSPPPDSDPFSDAEFEKTPPTFKPIRRNPKMGDAIVGEARLLIILNQLRREFVQFKLRGHSLQAGSKRFDFLLLLRDSCFQLPQLYH